MKGEGQPVCGRAGSSQRGEIAAVAAPAAFPALAPDGDRPPAVGAAGRRTGRGTAVPAGGGTAPQHRDHHKDQDIEDGHNERYSKIFSHNSQNQRGEEEDKRKQCDHLNMKPPE